MLESKLIKIGLTKKEAKVYIALFKFGTSAASVLARITGIGRTSMYDVLSSLIQKNLIIEQKRDRYNYYEIDDVNKILYQEKEKYQIAKEIISEFNTEINRNENIQIVHYKGFEGYREMYEHILKINPKEFIGWINLDHFYKVLDSDYEDNWTKLRISKKIHVRLLMQNSKLAKIYKSQDKESNRETRLIDTKKHPFNTTCLIYNNFIVYFDTTNEISGIRIQNSELAQMQKAIFEMNWKNLKS